MRLIRKYGADQMKLGLMSWAFALAAMSGAAQAHEVWVERDGSGPARVYLGEPAEPVPPLGDPEFGKLKAPIVFTADPRHAARLTRKADHIEAAVSDAGDVRVQDATIFEPWKSGEAYTGAIFYARAGRTETRTVLDLEISPVAPGGDTYVVLYKGRPAPAAKVTVVDPQRWSKSFEADAQGRVTVRATESGRYLLAVSHQVEEPATLGGREVSKVLHVSTLTFVNP